MIVFVMIEGYDKSLAVQVEQLDKGFVRISGRQLYLVAPEEDKPYVNTQEEYYLHSNAVKRKCYDCYQINEHGKLYEPAANTDYILRCSGYHPKTGSPGFKPSEAIAAGLPPWKVLGYMNTDTGLIHIRPSMLKAC